MIPITKSDTADLNPKIQSIYVGGAGNLVIMTPAGDLVTFNGALAGHIYPIKPLRVMAASTTTNLVGLTQ